jgi:hypothetical protein
MVLKAFFFFVEQSADDVHRFALFGEEFDHVAMILGVFAKERKLFP